MEMLESLSNSMSELQTNHTKFRNQQLKHYQVGTELKQCSSKLEEGMRVHWVQQEKKEEEEN